MEYLFCYSTDINIMDGSLKMIKNDKCYLITTDNWFYAPDGEQYRSVWGYFEIINKFTPLKPSTDWFLKCGKLIIAGSQIHYIIECEKKPKIQTKTREGNGEITIHKNIYIPE